jgi:hypothetical protein
LIFLGGGFDAGSRVITPAFFLSTASLYLPLLRKDKRAAGNASADKAPQCNPGIGNFAPHFTQKTRVCSPCPETRWFITLLLLPLLLVDWKVRWLEPSIILWHDYWHKNTLNTLITSPSTPQAGRGVVVVHTGRLANTARHGSYSSAHSLAAALRDSSSNGSLVLYKETRLEICGTKEFYVRTTVLWSDPWSDSTWRGSMPENWRILSWRVSAQPSPELDGELPLSWLAAPAPLHPPPSHPPIALDRASYSIWYKHGLRHGRTVSAFLGIQKPSWTERKVNRKSR